MNALFEHATNRLVQVTAEPVSPGDSLAVNGKFLIPCPDGAAYDISPSDNPTGVAGKAASALLVRYPMYENVSYNFFLDATGMDGIDTANPVPGPAGYTVSRCMLGRGGAGPAPTGAAVNSVAILPQNNFAASAEPGLLVTATIDISGVAPAGTDEVLVWWHVAQFSTSQDTVTGTSPEPAIRTLTYSNQEPAGLSVYASNDDGATWYSVDRLLPVSLVNPGTDLRIAFVNTGSSRIYLLGFAVLYSEA